jgi:hypothetical protein
LISIKYPLGGDEIILLRPAFASIIPITADLWPGNVQYTLFCLLYHGYMNISSVS